MRGNFVLVISRPEKRPDSRAALDCPVREVERLDHRLILIFTQADHLRREGICMLRIFLESVYP